MGAISKLNAVNRMLIAAGESPVNDLEGNSGVDTNVCLEILEEASLDLQLMGLATNLRELTITTNDEGKLVLPSTGDDDEDEVISADLLRYINGNNIWIVARVAAGSPKRLWNVTDDTDVFPDGDYCVRLVRKVKWENLDTVFQRAALATAKRHYQMQIQADGDADYLLAVEEEKFHSMARSHDIMKRQASITSSYSSIMKDALLSPRRPTSYYDPIYKTRRGIV